MSEDKLRVLAEAYKQAKDSGDKAAQDKYAKGLVALRKQMDLTKPVPQDFSVAETAKNLPGSAYRLAADTVKTFSQPVEAAKALGQATAGGLYNANEALRESMPESLSFMAEPLSGDKVLGEDYQENADAVGEFYKERYGDTEKAKATVMRDPAGAMADLSMLTALGSLFVPKGGKIGAAAEKAGKVAAAADPINVAMNLAKSTAKNAVPSGFARNQMMSAVKLNTTTPTKDAERMIDTMLREKIMPTNKGVNKAWGIVNDINDTIDRLVKEATKSGKTIPRGALFRRLKKAREKVGGTRIEAGRDLKFVDGVAKRLDQQLKSIGKDRLNAQDLQNLKRSVWNEIYGDKQRLSSFDAKDSAREAIGQQAKAELEKMSPQISSENMREGEILELMKQLPRKVQRIENMNNIPLIGPSNLGIGYIAGDTAGAVLGGLATIVGMPANKARVALTADQIRKMNTSMMQYRPSTSGVRSLVVLDERMNDD